MEMFFALVFVGLVIMGALVRRWRALIAAPLAGIWAAWEIPLENAEPPHLELALVVTFFAAAAIAIGVMGRAMAQGRVPRA